MISVCMPYWRRPAQLARLFHNYGEVYPELPLEFSVCDDGSPEAAEVPASHSVSVFHQYVLTRLPTKTRPLNPCVPINRAVAAARGDIIVLTNPEIRHDGPVLHQMLAMLEHPLDYVVAPCYDIQRQMWTAGETVDYTKNGRLPVPPGAHFHFLAMFRRELWDLAGGFDEDYRHGTACDDNDWLWRAHRIGARFKLSAAPVYHDHVGRPTAWGMPFNGDLFFQKWPEARGQ